MDFQGSQEHEEFANFWDIQGPIQIHKKIIEYHKTFLNSGGFRIKIGNKIA